MCKERTIERKVMCDMCIPIVKVTNPSESWRGTACYIDGNKVRNVKSVDFRVAVDEVPTFTFETIGLPEIDMAGTVQFSFTPETIQQAAFILQNEFKSNQESKKALIASIECAIDDSKKGISTRDLSEIIANTIIGLEDN